LSFLSPLRIPREKHVLIIGRTAGEIASEVLKKVVEACTPGRVVFELCAYGDSLIDDAVRIMTILITTQIEIQRG